MASEKDAKGCLVILCLLVCLMPIIGGIWYGIQRVKEMNYAQTNCLIVNYTVLTEACGIRDSCFKPLWIVVYNTTNFIPMNSTIKSSLQVYTYDSAVKQAETHGINKTSICFYDNRRHHDVQWDVPDSIPGLIIMIIGLVLFVIIASLTLYFVGPTWKQSIVEFWQQRHVKQERQQLVSKSVKFKHNHHDDRIHW